MSKIRFLILSFNFLIFSCGYHLVGTSSSLPENIKSIYVPTFKNNTSQPEVEERLTDAVAKEISQRGVLKLAKSKEEADGILLGEINQFDLVPVNLDKDGRALEYQIVVGLKVSLKSIDEVKIYFENDSFRFYERYPIDITSTDYFDKLYEVVDDMSSKFAESLVTTLMEGF